MGTVLTLGTPAGFSLPHTVCSYGYFILAPNRWEPRDGGRTGVLHRPLRDRAGRVIHVRITQPGEGRLRVRCHRRVGREHHERLKGQVGRMLRLEEDLSEWRRMHAEADRWGFDRIFRSPTLFEDIVKTMTSCNITWPATIKMNRLLCERAGRHGDFPTPGELAGWEPDELAEACRVGYRAERIIRLARDVKAGRVKPSWFQHPERGTEELYRALRGIHGIGDFAASNLLQLLGHYDRLAIDSETIRHFRQVHGIDGEAGEITGIARQHYERYAPYQFLAYWFELWSDYERRFGRAMTWDSETHEKFTARELRG